MRHLEELQAHYTSAVGAEPEFGTMTSLEGTTVGIFHWPRASSRMGVSLYASAGISVPGPGGRSHSHTVEVFTGIKGLASEPQRRDSGITAVVLIAIEP